MEISIAVGALTAYPLRTTLQYAASAGADGVEIMLTPRLVRDHPERMERVAAETGVPILSAHAILSFGRRTLDQQLRTDLASIRSAAQISTCRVLVLHPPLTGPHLSSDLDRWLEAITRERDLAKPELKLGLENRSNNDHRVERQLLDDLERLRDVASEWGVHVTLDVAHAASHGIDVVGALEQVGSRLVNVHLSDSNTRKLDGPIVTGLFRDHLIVGEGILPIADGLDRLRCTEYKELITLEFSPLSLRAFWPKAARTRLRQAITVVRGMLNDQSQSATLDERFSQQTMSSR